MGINNYESLTATLAMTKLFKFSLFVDQSPKMFCFFPCSAFVLKPNILKRLQSISCFVRFILKSKNFFSYELNVFFAAFP
jgi:hypothetical protein